MCILTRRTLDRGKLPTAKCLFPILKINLNRAKKPLVHSKCLLMHDGYMWLAVKTLWSILLFLTRSSPLLLEPWVLVVLLFRRQKAQAFNTSSTILDHGIKIHVSSFPLSDLSKTQTHLKDRYSPTESLHRSFVRQFTYNCQ
jgi:hypothetical protein